MDEKKEKALRKEAREILDKFAAALDKVKIKEKSLKGKVGGFRDEKDGKECDSDFRKRMFENAPSKEGDSIVAEKKKW
tara:strand:+ start:3710 stop:3943 length:234 start_codon:yes stop_codon:yes gene_type:complete